MNHDDILDTWIKNKSFYQIYYVGLKGRKNFNYDKALKFLKNDKFFYKHALKDWPRGIAVSQGKTKEIKSKAKPMKDVGKKLKLENLTERRVEDLKTAEGIYYANAARKNFDYERGLNALIKVDKTGFYIHRAGRTWPIFNFKKGLDALIKIDKTSEYIFDAGRDWKNFDFEKGLDALIKKDIDGYYIYQAGLNWKKFDYDKGLKILSNSRYHKYALKDWPRNIKMSQIISKQIKSKAKPMKDAGKKLKLKEDIDKMNAQDIYRAGRYRKKFDYEKGFETLIKADKTGKWIFNAGIHWKKFNYSKGLKVLKIFKNIYYKYALKDWPKDIKVSQERSKEIKSKAKPMKDVGKKLKLENLTERRVEDFEGLGANDIYLDGRAKKNFDFEKGLDALIKIDKDGYYIYQAGLNWKKFNYDKGLKALKARKIYNSYYYGALNKWPKDIKASQAISKEIKSKARPMKDVGKKYTIKEDTKMKFKNLLKLIKAAILYKRKNKSIKEDIIRLAEQKELQKSSRELSSVNKRSALKAVYKKILMGTPYANNIKAFQQLIDQVPDDYVEYESQINLPSVLKMVNELIQGKGDFTGNELKNIMNVVSGIGIPAIEKHAAGKEKMSKETGTFGAKAINKNTAEMIASMKKRKSTLAIPSRTTGKKPVITSKQLVRPDDLVKLFKTGGLTLTGEFGKTASQIRSRGMNMERIAKSLNNIIANSKNYKEAEKKAKEALKLDFQENLFRSFFKAAKKEKVPVKRK